MQIKESEQSDLQFESVRDLRLTIEAMDFNATFETRKHPCRLSFRKDDLQASCPKD